jgi:hypothetical protein
MVAILLDQTSGGNDELIDAYTVAWLLWIFAFILIETSALRNQEPGDTLSEHVWEWFGTGVPKGERTLWWLVKRIILVGFLVWLLGHFLWGI